MYSSKLCCWARFCNYWIHNYQKCSALCQVLQWLVVAEDFTHLFGLSRLSFLVELCATTQDSHVMHRFAPQFQGMATCLQQETTLFWIPSAMVPMSGPGSNWPNLMGLKCDGYRLTRTGSCGSSLEKKVWLFLLTEYEFHGCRVSPSNIKTAQRINSITTAWRAKNDRFHFNIFLWRQWVTICHLSV
jgi:hypothetical protein